MFNTCAFEDAAALYSEECAICLGSWETSDSIKITPCGHAYHAECIGNWLKSARTCALCRQDLVILTSQNAVPASNMGASPANANAEDESQRRLDAPGLPGSVPPALPPRSDGDERLLGIVLPTDRGTQV